MAKLTDGKRTVEILMMTWNGTGYGPDWSNDFFEVGVLPTNEDGAHVVQDVAYCIEQAEDWKHQRGDYADDGLPSPDDRFVDYVEVYEDRQRYELDGYKDTIRTHYVAIRNNDEEALAFAKELMQEHDLDRIQVCDNAGNLIYEL